MMEDYSLERMKSSPKKKKCKKLLKEKLESLIDSLDKKRGKLAKKRARTGLGTRRREYLSGQLEGLSEATRKIGKYIRKLKG